MSKITGITAVAVDRCGSKIIEFTGGLRNERIFSVGDSVFALVNGNRIIQTKVVGFRIPLDDNPEYRYTILIPSDVAENKCGGSIKSEGDLEDEITCHTIFASLDDAKDNAIKYLDSSYRVRKDYIESFFKQFEKQQ